MLRPGTAGVILAAMLRRSVILGMLCALASCAKREAPVRAGAAATAAAAPAAANGAAPGTPAPAPGQAAVTIAPPAPDAALAGAKELKVLVPKSVDDGAAGDPLDALAKAIAKEVAAASGKKAAARIVIYADTTVDYGCLCPPFVFAPFWNSGRSDGYVLPIFAKGVPDASATKQGIFRFAGHFDGRRITGLEWLKQRGEKASEGMSEYEHKAPVFVVEGWCFEPVEAFGAASAEEAYGGSLKQMARDGRFCAGTRYPAPPEPEEP